MPNPHTFTGDPFLVKSLVIHQIFTKFAIGLVTGQGKVLA